MRVGAKTAREFGAQLQALDSLAAPAPAVLVRSVMSGPPPICEQDVSILHASQLMAGHRAVLVRAREGFGIVTDSDMRERVVAARVSTDRPIGQVMTFPARVIDPDRLAAEVALEMLEIGVHHLPVAQGGAVIGMVSDLELLNVRGRTSFTLRDRFDGARTTADLVEAGRELPLVAVELWKAGLDGAHIGQWLAVLTDRLTSRLLDAGLERLGPPPVDFAWLALGSLGRREQALTADQDHALVYAEGGDEHDSYFKALADEVVASLAESGFPKCESRVMASEADWRMSLPAWLGRMDRWIAAPDRVNSFLSGIVFDYRQISGSLELVPQLDRVIARAAEDPRFVKRMSALAIDHPSPLGLGGRLMARKVNGHLRVLDMKKFGLFPVTDLARALALGSGLAVSSTLERLRSVAKDSEWSEAGASLGQVYKFCQQVRFQHQVQQKEADLQPDDLVPIGSLDRLTRIQLRGAFGVLRSVQDEVSYWLGITR